MNNRIRFKHSMRNHRPSFQRMMWLTMAPAREGMKRHLFEQNILLRKVEEKQRQYASAWESVFNIITREAAT